MQAAKRDAAHSKWVGLLCPGLTLKATEQSTFIQYMETKEYSNFETECLGAINATLRRHTFAIERVATALENLESDRYCRGTEPQEVN